MRSTQYLLALGSLVGLATALSEADFKFPETVPLEKRQTEGPAYECHSSCGLAIKGSRDGNYCDSTEWRNYLDKCLDCAVEFDIWQHYGRLGDIANACGIDATPKPVSGNASSGSTPVPEPTSAQVITGDSSRDSVTLTTTTVATTTPVLFDTSSTPTPPVSGGAEVVRGSFSACGIALLMAIALM